MRKKIFLFTFLLIVMICGYSFACCNNGTYYGNAFIYDQDDLKALEGYTKITGSLYILDSDVNFPDIDELYCLEQIGGWLVIGATELVNIDGLQNVKSIGQGDPVNSGITINNNNNLIDISGLDNVEYFPAFVQVSNNDSLEHIDGMNSAKGCPLLKVRIYLNDSLETINGFTGLEQTIEIKIYSNAQLRSINGFTNTDNVEYISIRNNDLMETINGFTNIYQAETIDIYNNYALEEINGFSNLEIAQELYMVNIPYLYDISGFSKVNTLSRLTFDGLDDLTSILPELEKLEHVYQVLGVVYSGVCESEVDQLYNALITKPTYYVNDNNQICY